MTPLFSVALQYMPVELGALLKLTPSCSGCLTPSCSDCLHRLFAACQQQAPARCPLIPAVSYTLLAVLATMNTPDFPKVDLKLLL